MKEASERADHEAQSGAGSRPAPLAEERPVSIVVGSKRLAVLMCTPRELDELAIGYLFSRGVIAFREELASFFICSDRSAVNIRLHDERGIDSLPELFLPSGCGAAAPEGEPRVLIAPKVPPGSTGVTLADVGSSMRNMFGRAEIHRATGGVHCASLRLGSGELLVREDVGRHNAVDKLLGRMVLDALDLEGAVLLTSGRIAWDIVHKAAMAGLPLIASRSIPTNAAFDLAMETGITLIGRATSPGAIVYSHKERIDES